MKNLNCSADALFLNAAKYIKPTGVFYVGAYCGDGLDMFKSYNCPVYAFEPNPSHFEKIQNKYTSLNIPGKPYQVGVANFTGKLNLNIPDQDQIASSFLKTKEITNLFTHMRLKNQVLADIVALDDLDIRDANYLLLDIQGCEFNAILGVYNTILNHVDVIVTEYSTVELYSTQNQVRDLDNLLTELGFFTKSDLTHVHADAVYFKNKYKSLLSSKDLITHPIITQTGQGMTMHDYGFNNEW